MRGGTVQLLGQHWVKHKSHLHRGSTKKLLNISSWYQLLTLTGTASVAVKNFNQGFLDNVGTIEIQKDIVGNEKQHQ